MNLRSFIKNLAPEIVKEYYTSWKYSKNKSFYHQKSTKEVFTQIFTHNSWGDHESKSGIGSSGNHPNNALKAIETVTNEFNIHSILDIPCGDFNWMKKMNLRSIKYTGADIVEELIKDNRLAYAASNIQFTTLNLIKDELPGSDLIIIRDCFVHFSYKDIFSSVSSIKKSNSNYLLTTTFNDLKINYDITTGDWRPINLCRKPFNFPNPIRIFEESVEEKHKNEFKGKALALWKIEDLKIKTQ